MGKRYEKAADRRFSNPFKFNSGYGQSGPMYLFHNTADAALPGNNGLYIKAPGTWDVIYARNNIWVGTEYAIENYNAAQPTDLDYDDLRTGDGGDLVRWDDTRYATLAAFAAATGQEVHGLNAEPGFVDSANGDYALRGDSTLIDAGVLIPGINDEYAGNAPDIGAYEYQGQGFSLIATPSVQAIAPGGVATYTLYVQSIGGFSDLVALVATSPSPSLMLSLAPTVVLPSAYATLTLIDTHPGPNHLPGVWYGVPVTAAGGSFAQAVSVRLLVGGARAYLPLVIEE